MSDRSFLAYGRRFWWISAALVLTIASARPADAQIKPPPSLDKAAVSDSKPLLDPAAGENGTTHYDSAVQQAGCSTCSGGLFSGGCTGGCAGHCIPDRLERCC